MPEKGFKDVLSADFKSNLSVISVEEQPALHMVDYIQEIISNHESAKYRVQLLLFGYNANIFEFGKTNSNVIVHDFVRNPFNNLESLFEDIVKSKTSAFYGCCKNILILDDLSMFLIFGSCKVPQKPLTFLRKIKEHVTKTVVFLNKETISLEEAASFYDIADALTMIRGSTNSKLYSCDLIKMKSIAGAKIRHERTMFEVSKGEVKPLVIPKDTSFQNSTNSDDVLRNLTTFKLTLEEDEKQSKSRLHLPYFDAQKTSVESTAAEDYFDEEEEEEEP